jgi:hypothetical protein
MHSANVNIRIKTASRSHAHRFSSGLSLDRAPMGDAALCGG